MKVSKTIASKEKSLSRYIQLEIETLEKPRSLALYLNLFIQRENKLERSFILNHKQSCMCTENYKCKTLFLAVNEG